MNTLELLLSADTKKVIERVSKDVEVPRLSKLIGGKFIVTCYPLTNEQVNHVKETSKTDLEAQLGELVEGCRIDGKKFSDKSLREKFGVVSGVEVVSKLFNPGEILKIHNMVLRLSGFTLGSIEEVEKVKN